MYGCNGANRLNRRLSLMVYMCDYWVMSVGGGDEEDERCMVVMGQTDSTGG